MNTKVSRVRVHSRPYGSIDPVSEKVKEWVRFTIIVRVMIRGRDLHPDTAAHFFSILHFFLLHKFVSFVLSVGVKRWN